MYTASWAATPARGADPDPRRNAIRDAAAKGDAFCFIREKLQEDQWKLRGADDPYGIAALKQSHDVTKVLGMVSDNDWYAVPRWLNNIVTPFRN